MDKTLVASLFMFAIFVVFVVAVLIINFATPNMKKKCPNCGKRVKANAKFCSQCGSKL